MSPARLQVSAGTGPLEARQFVALLAEHLGARCAELGAAPVAVAAHGPETAPSCVVLHLPEAPPGLVSLTGTHALVARSEERGKNARKRWFVGVTLLAELPGAGAVPELRREDVVVTACRAGGPGGQHVNKTESAVRARHVPSGLSVRVSDERSRHQNLRVALARLAALLAEQSRGQTRDALAEGRIRHYRVERGRPVFTYQLTRRGELSPCVPTCSR